MTSPTTRSASHFFARFFGEFFGGFLLLFMIGFVGITLAFPSSTNAQTTACVRAGCSGHLCISAAQAQNGLSTTCEFRDEYACYQQADCVLLSSGTCGWQPTAQLSQCLAAAQDDTLVTGDDQCAMTGFGCTNFTIDPLTGLCKTSDINGDGKTDIKDYTVLVSQFMDVAPHSTLSADLNCDDKVDLIDYSLLIRNIEL